MAKEFWNGNTSAAEAVKLCGVEVVAAYPITPQTALMEQVAANIGNGLMNARMVPVESEHSAMSTCAGASVVGARTFTATSSQGLIYMSEVLHMTSGCRLPVVMAVVHRSVSAPVNTSADQQDSMLQRDAGWVMLECNSAQDVYDTIPMAYRIGEDPSVHLPVMVCFDGFTISHTSEEVESLSHDEVDGILAPVNALRRPVLDVDQPFQLNQLLPADAYSEYQYKKHMALKRAIGVVESTHQEFADNIGRHYSTVDAYLCEDAEVIYVGMGSIMSSTKWVVNKLRESGKKVGLVSVRLFRPFPEDMLVHTTANAKVLAVIEKNIGLGTSGMMFPDVVRAFCNNQTRPGMLNFIVGLGGRNVPPETIERCYELSDRYINGEVNDIVLWPDTNIGI
ncbi:MAG: pyruvate ferredoxin oxidoreductase [Chloroflexota bacterium]|nr:pyruvate ferredoxin oxidoreductase [Chloroflexota bacterium]